MSSSSLVPVQSDGKKTLILKPSDYLAGGHYFTRGAKRNVESSLAKNAVVQTFPAVKPQTRIINADSVVASSRSFDEISPQKPSDFGDSHTDLTSGQQPQLSTVRSGEIITPTVSGTNTLAHTHARTHTIIQ